MPEHPLFLPPRLVFVWMHAEYLALVFDKVMSGDKTESQEAAKGLRLNVFVGWKLTNQL